MTAMPDSEQQMDIKVSRGPGLAGSDERPRRTASRGLAERPAGGQPAWDWSADELFGAELTELREAVSALRAQVAELERSTARAREREHELRAELSRLAAAGLRERRRLRVELAARGLL
jgi:hypothetical protein